MRATGLEAPVQREPAPVWMERLTAHVAESLKREAKKRKCRVDELFYDLCAEVVHEHMEMLAKTAVDYGFPKEKIFSHIVALESYDNGSLVGGTFVESPPIWTSINDYCIPGFTLDQGGAAKYDLKAMRKIFEKYDKEFKYGAVETYLFHYPTGNEYIKQLNDFIESGATLVSVFGAVSPPDKRSSPFDLNDEMAKSVRKWLDNGSR